MDKSELLRANCLLNEEQRQVIAVARIAFERRQPDARVRVKNLLSSASREMASLVNEYGAIKSLSHQRKFENHKALVTVLSALLEEYHKANLNLVGCDEGPTAETVFKSRIRPDPILRLNNIGHIDWEHVRAAREIAQVFEAVTSRLAVRISKMDGDGAKRGKGSTPSNFLPDFLADWYDHRYLPWVRVVEADKRLDLPLVLLLAVEGIPISEAKKLRGMSHGRATEIIKDALGLYDMIRSGRLDAPSIEQNGTKEARDGVQTTQPT